MSEGQLISAVKQVFAKDKRKYISVLQMERKLGEEGLSHKEDRQATLLARTKREIGMCYPPRRELCYELLTEEDIKLENRCISALINVFDKTEKQFIKVDEMKQLLLGQNLTPEEVEQTISLAKANQVIRWRLPHIHEIRGRTQLGATNRRR